MLVRMKEKKKTPKSIHDEDDDDDDDIERKDRPWNGDPEQESREET